MTSSRSRNARANASFVLLCWLTWCAATCGAAEAPAGLEQLDVEPREVRLVGARAAVQLVVTGRMAGGELRDLTRAVEYVAPSSVRVVDGLVLPQADGDGALEIRLGQLRATVAVHVERQAMVEPISFRNEALAVFTKQGCNGGSCHGKPNGRGALELSLNAFDPAADERTLIRAPLLRFTHPLEPTESLLLKKPLLQIPHGGGKRLRPGDPAYAILRQWIEEGCSADPAGTPQCVGIDVFPPGGRTLVLRTAAAPADRTSDDDSRAQAPAVATQQVRVVARFSDGSRRDVTRIAAFSTSNEQVARVAPDGLVTGSERGQAAVVVRYLDFIVSSHLTLVRDDPTFVWPNPPENNFVDTLVHQKLRQLQFAPSEDADDATFFRRLSLDVRGLLPSPAETHEFLADSRPNKRALWIDRLLESPEHARFWGLRLADLLRINRQKLPEARAAEYSRWVFESVARNQPYDAFVRELLTSQGETDEVPAANFFRVTNDTNTVTETVAQLFLGSRVLCAQCHNHPYESWTQDNYYQIGAAFHELDRRVVKPDDPNPPAPVKARKGKRKSNEERDATMVVSVAKNRPLANPRTGVVQLPWPTDVPRGADEDKRQAFARWLTAPGNPYFARVAVNRMWAQLFGRGLVEPIDDFRSSNPAVNVALLDVLAADFERSGFDRRHALRTMLNSRTYQRSSRATPANAEDDLLGSHARTRLLSAEQVQDAILRVCEGPERLPQLQAELAEAEAKLREVRANTADSNESPAIDAAEKDRDAKQARVDGYYMTQQPYPLRTPFLAAFGQPPRETACACERRTDTNLDQALQLMNSDLIRGQVQQAAGRFERATNEALIDELYVAALGRAPAESERDKLLAYLRSAADRRRAIEDVVWAVLNTNEFLFQH